MNSYYDEILKEILELFDKGQNQEALILIKQELKMPYIPQEFEKKLQELDNKYKMIKKNETKIDDDNLIDYLKGNEYSQMIAVNYLDNLNLRDYLDICEDYLINGTCTQAKCLLVSSLINQEINNEIKMIKDGIEIVFIPKYQESIEISDGFIAGDNFLKKIFENDNPSLYKMAKDLLIKECFLELPLSYDMQEGLIIAKRICLYLYDCLQDLISYDNFIKKYVNEEEMKLIKIKKL